MAIVHYAIDAARFDYDRDLRAWIQHTSQLEGFAWEAIDGGDITLRVDNARKVFVLAHVNTNARGAITSWIFRAFEKHSPYRVLIVNDAAPAPVIAKTAPAPVDDVAQQRVAPRRVARRPAGETNAAIRQLVR